MSTEQIVSLVVAVLSGLAACIPLAVKLVQYVQKAVQEKNWGQLLGLLVDLMEEAEQKFDTGATRKEWVMAMVQTSAEYIAYPIDTQALSDLIDGLIDMTNNINVASQFMTHITTSFWFAFVLSFPYLIFEVWRFVSPALYQNEKKSVGLAFTAGTFMFFLGCAVGYTLVFPLTFRFLTEYQLSETIANQISLNSYMGNFLMMIFIMGVVFELPLLAWLLSKMGLVTKDFFRKYRKYAVVVLLVLAAVITPSGDPFTLIVVFLPLYLLYELSILFVKEGKEELTIDN